MSRNKDRYGDRKRRRNDDVKSRVIWLIDGAYVLKGHKGRIDYIDIRRKMQI